MSEDDVAASPAPAGGRRQHTRRSLLSIPPLVAAAFVLAPKPARARSRVVECLADLGEF